MVTQDQIKDLLHYEQETGRFTWIVSRGSARKGTEAGCVQTSMGKKYRYIRVLGSFFGAHRLAFVYMTGAFPPGKMDHQDGNGLNNAWSNLRQATSLENGKNQRLHSNNVSGIVGVRWYKAGSKWHAAIMVNRRKKHLGYFTNKEEAIAARKAAEIEFGFHQNHGSNRPL